MRLLAALLVTLSAAAATPVGDADRAAAGALMTGFSRAKSQLLARVIETPSRAALDRAAFEANPLFWEVSGGRLTAPFPQPDLFSATFEGLLVPGTVVDTLGETALSAAEQAESMAALPLGDYLAKWNFTQAEALLTVFAQVSRETWGQAYGGVPLQRVSRVWLHSVEGVLQLWFEIEFDPAVDFIQGLTDNDADGLAECYGQLAGHHLETPLLERLRDDYLGRRLTDDEVEQYFFELASGWYPTYNTVVLKPEQCRPWPTAETEEPLRTQLGATTFASPTAVLKSQPREGHVLYFIFLVNTDPPPATAPTAPTEPAPPPAPPAPPAAGVTPHEANLARWRDELARFGGGRWEAWAETLAPFRDAVRQRLEARPARLKAIFADDGSLFFRGCLEYLVAGDLRRQANDRDPFPAIVDYHEQLAARGVKLLLVVIPTRPEIVPRQAGPLPEGHTIAQPYTRKLLLELGEAGVEAVDLLPAFLAEAGRDTPDGEPFYMFQDTHWSNRAVRLAAKLIADRIRLEPAYQRLSARVDYGTREVAVTRLGDLRGLLTEPEKLQFPPMRLAAQQVLRPDGKPYEDDPSSPFLVLGDSFCGVFQHEDCRHAGLTAHLARELGRPMDLLMAHGSGPQIRNQVLQRGAEAFRGKRIVVWTVAARDLWNYWAPWAKVPLP